MSFVRLESVSKTYRMGGRRSEKVSVFSDLSLQVEKHDVICLIGPSGCGKSTMLRCINGLEPIDSGSVFVGDLEVSSPIVSHNAVRRRVGMVFQHFNLFPHMSALDNVVVAQRKVLKRSKESSTERAIELLTRVGLADHMAKFPESLSGGQQQRVAIARALAMDPQALLLDEITSALDPELVGEVLSIVRELASEGMTMLLATHEMSFAREVATRVCFVGEGGIYEQGSSEQLFGDPQRPLTKAFLRRLVESRRL